MVKKNPSIVALLNAYKRINYLDTQIESLISQSIPPSKIYVWFNNNENVILKSKYLDQIVLVDCKENMGVWARFSFALNIKSEYIAIFDDDTIPGKKWFENCLAQSNKEVGLFGTRGLRFKNDKRYVDYEEFGWNNPNSDLTEVDIVGHSWFFKNELINIFWGTDSPGEKIFNAGEDIHFSYALQKNGIKTFVPPHPKEDIELWGSMPKSALEIGSDQYAISKNSDSLEKFQNQFIIYIGSGFLPYYLRSGKVEKKIIITSGTKFRKLYYDKYSKNKFLSKIIKFIVNFLDKMGISI